MRRLLQSIVHNRKLYDRPHDEWTCGRAAEGCPCIYGPSAKGECRATGQCLPAKKGDRWVCTRAISLGGACPGGPSPDGTCGCPVPPCRPVRSLRAVRGSLTRLVAALALGIAILALWGQTRPSWSNPGPLTTQHAVSAQDCAACHTAEAGRPLAGAAGAERVHQHDQLCINCHDLGPQPLSPHGAPPAELLALARGSQPATGERPVVLAALRTMGAPAELACATCHREHQGADFDLKRMADQQCQVCHHVQFRGFASGHPEFAGYPYARRTRLQFDHVAHFQRHFNDARLPVTAPTSCAHCHEPAPDGGKMLVRGFEQACASCHRGQIDGTMRAGTKGLVFLRLPEVDLAALVAAGHDTGEWPADAEGGITPFMRWLLEGDDAASAALATLGGRSLANLADATPDQKAAAAKLLWGVKGLFADLVTDGQQVIVKRLGSAAVARPEVSGRAGQFSADAALAAQQAWLPHLLTEVAAHRRGAGIPRFNPEPTPLASRQVEAAGPAPAGSDDLLGDDLLAGPAPAATPPASAQPIAAPPATLELDDAEARVTAGGWYRMDDSYTLHYRPGDHADAFLTAWLGGTVGSTSPAARDIFKQLSAENAPGSCMKCHTVDETPAATIVNWRTSRPQPDFHPFTKFTHSAHFSLMGDQGCMTCHTFDMGADYAGSFGANRNPAIFRSNFAPLPKGTCATCHQPERSGESCQQCHNYHTGEMKKLRSQAAEMPTAVRRK